MQGGRSTVPHVLLHPLENVEAVQLAEGGTAAGETIVWTSLDLPYLASYNEVRSPQSIPAGLVMPVLAFALKGFSVIDFSTWGSCANSSSHAFCL